MMAVYKPTYTDERTGGKKQQAVWWLLFHLRRAPASGASEPQEDDRGQGRAEPPPARWQAHTVRGFALQFLPTRVMDWVDRNPVQEKLDEYQHSRIAGNNGSAGVTPEAQAGGEENQARKEGGGPKKGASNPNRANKKAAVITLLKRVKGATLAEIMAATKWQAHTVRGFVSILGSKGGEKIESAKNDAGERLYRIAK
jgi:hypothetical protein